MVGLIGVGKPKLEKVLRRSKKPADEDFNVDPWIGGKFPLSPLIRPRKGAN